MDETEIEIQSFELELAEGAHSVTLPGDPDQDILLLVERIDENAVGGLECRVEQVDTEQISQAPSVAAFVGRLFPEGRSLTVRLWASSRQQIRITFARFRKIAAAVGKRISCNTCKRLVGSLLIAALSSLGVHLVAGGTITLTSAQIAALKLLLSKGALGKLIAKYGMANLWNQLMHVLETLNWMLGLTESLFERVCRYVGLCPAMPIP